MSGWNYVVTAHKPTNVTHSCVGYFTNPQELNLIIAYPHFGGSLCPFSRLRSNHALFMIFLFFFLLLVRLYLGSIELI